MLEAPQEVQETQPPLKENSPTVSVDIRLGQVYEDVVFDYDAFEQEASRRGISTDEHSDLSISLTPRNFYHLNRGMHYPSESRIDIGVRKQSQVNKTLRHELQHAGDYRSDNPNHRGSDLRYMFWRPLKNPILLLSGYVGVRASIDTLQAYDAHSSLLAEEGKALQELAALTPSKIALLSLMAVYLWSYQFHPRERRARKAGRQKGDDIVLLKKKTNA